jgi:hypothetical protein
MKMKNFKNFQESTTETPENIQIEVLGVDDNWRRVEGGVPNRAQSIARSLENAKKRYPKNRVRAVGQKTGRFYDMLP